jgi:hypothetical protein
MRFANALKSILMGTGSVLGGAAVLVVVLTLAVPRAAHAVVAALVEVVNTTANPAVTQDTSKAASQIVHLTTLGKAAVAPAVMTPLHQYITGGTFGPAYVVPAGQNFVITSIEASAQTASGNYLNLYDNTTLGQREFWYFPNAGTSQLVFPSGLVFPAGTPVYVYIGGVNTTQMFVDLHGYLTAN